jgi:hypothetical protein
MSRLCWLAFIPVCLVEGGFFWFVSQHHYIDGDEGFYLLASQLVQQHKKPYVDFFYTQAPLLPYAYAMWFKIAGISWFAARKFAAIQTAILAGLVYEQVCHDTRKCLAGLSAVLLFASSTLIFAWLPIVKTFALATLFLFIAYVILVRVTPSSAGRWYATAGFFWGLSVTTRAYFLMTGPLLLYWIFSQPNGRRFSRILRFVGGLIVGVTPSLVLFLAAPDAYWFDNLGYHAIRSNYGLVGAWPYKVKIVLSLFGGHVTGLQVSLLTLICVILILVRRAKRDAALLAILTAFFLGFASILPTPPYIQYFSVMVPFLITAAVCLACDYFAALRNRLALIAATVLSGVLLLSFVAVGVQNFRPSLFTPQSSWTLKEVTAVSRAVDEMTAPGEEVASFWPGYIFSSTASPYPGMENNFGVWVGYKLSARKRQKYHILAETELVAAFARRGPPFVVVGNQESWSGGPDYSACVRMLDANGYFPARAVGNTWIFECCTRPQAPDLLRAAH